MKIDRIVNYLSKKLEEKYPSEVSEDHQQEGINTWNSRRVLPIHQWLKLTASIKNDKVVFDLSKGFGTIPDSTSEIIFQYGVEGSEEYYKEIPKEEFDRWFNDYLGFLTFKKDTELGSMICKNCLLSPHKDRSGLLIGVHKMAAKTLEEELKANKPLDVSIEEEYTSLEKISEDPVVYPCNVLNYFLCPYECDGQSKRFKHDLDSDIEYLFELDQITRLVDLALLKASSMTQSNETVYEINVAEDTIIEIRTLYNGEQVRYSKWNPVEEGLKRILDESVIPVRNFEDIVDILRDKNKLDMILKQGLSEEEYRFWKSKILGFYDQIESNFGLNFQYKYNVYKNRLIQSCEECGNKANIRVSGHKDYWICIQHWKRNDLHLS